jgi:hypothetical protein
VESSIKTSEGLFEPAVMFFGLNSGGHTNSLTTFQTMIFQEEIVQGWLLIYMEDAIITTINDETELV